MNRSINEVQERFFMMNVYEEDSDLDFKRGQGEIVYFSIDDVVSWKSIPTYDPANFYILIMFKGGHKVRTKHNKDDYDDIMLELEEAKFPWVKEARQMIEAKNDTH